MKATNRLIASIFAIGAGCALMFILAYTFDSRFAQPSSAIATAVGRDAQYFGMLAALVAGYLTACIARHHPMHHALTLAGIFVLTCLVQSLGRLQHEPWWTVVFGEIVPVAACSLAIWFGALIRSLYVQSRRCGTVHFA